MKKNVLLFIGIGMLIFVILVSCGDGETSPGISLLYDITIDDTEYAASATYDFGLTQAEGSGTTKTITLTNTGDIDVIVNSVVLSDEYNYSISIPSLPITTAAGDTVDVELTFSPQDSGSLPATVTITVEGITDPFLLNLTGLGNYAPAIKYGITVADAGDDDANGFYERDGSVSYLTSDIRPTYKKTAGTTYYCYPHESVSYWIINETRDLGAEPFIEYYDYSDSLLMVPPAAGWSADTGTSPAPSVTRYEITASYCLLDLALTANYIYFDADGDPENTGATKFQWYISETGDEDNTYSAISGATSNTYTPVSGDEYKFLKVAITPAASTGILAGAATLSSPTSQIGED